MRPDRYAGAVEILGLLAIGFVHAILGIAFLVWAIVRDRGDVSFGGPNDDPFDDPRRIEHAGRTTPDSSRREVTLR